MHHHDDVTYKTNFRKLELDTLSDVKTKNIEWFFLFLTSRDKQTVYLRDTVGSVATDSPRDIGGPYHAETQFYYYNISMI